MNYVSKCKNIKFLEGNGRKFIPKAYLMTGKMINWTSPKKKKITVKHIAKRMK